MTWKKNQNNDSKNDQKPWNQMEKMQESINKDLEELKNKHVETNTITEIKNTLEESIAEYQNQKKESVSWKIKWWKLLLKSR